MKRRISLRMVFSLVFLISLAGLVLAMGPIAQAQSTQSSSISAEVTEALGRMNKALLSNGVTFQAVTLRAYAGPNGELLHIVHKVKITARRPDRLRVDATGDDGSTKMFYDGAKLVIYGVDRKQYATLPVSGEIENMVDAAESRFGLDMPLADFVSNDPQKTFLAGLSSGVQVGTSTIDGVGCRHFFFSQAPDLEMELWLEDNEKSLPRRLIATYTSLPGRPSFIAELSNWGLSTKPADSEFTFEAPAGVTQVELASGTSEAAGKAAK